MISPVELRSDQNLIAHTIPLLDSGNSNDMRPQNDLSVFYFKSLTCRNIADEPIHLTKRKTQLRSTIKTLTVTFQTVPWTAYRRFRFNSVSESTSFKLHLGASTSFSVSTSDILPFSFRRLYRWSFFTARCTAFSFSGCFDPS